MKDGTEEARLIKMNLNDLKVCSFVSRQLPDVSLSQSKANSCFHERKYIFIKQQTFYRVLHEMFPVDLLRSFT